jgi:hypothetical protein
MTKSENFLENAVNCAQLAAFSGRRLIAETAPVLISRAQEARDVLRSAHLKLGRR